MEYAKFVELSKRIIVIHQNTELMFSREVESKNILIAQGYDQDVKRYTHGISYIGLDREHINLDSIAFSLSEMEKAIKHHQNLVYKSLILEFIENFLAFIHTKFGGNHQANIARILHLCDKSYTVIDVNAAVFLIYLWQLRNAIAHNDNKLVTHDEYVNKLGGNADAARIKEYLRRNGNEYWGRIDRFYTNQSRDILIIEKDLPSGGKIETVSHAFNVIFSCAKLIHENT